MVRSSRARKPRKPADAWRSYAAGSEIAHFAEFCEAYLEQSEDRWEGQPLKLESWQRRMMGEALAFDTDGWPVWESIVLIIARKNGKTAMLAALALYRLITGAGRPEVLLAASSDKQADRLFQAAARFVRRNAELRQLLRVRDHVGEIVREDGMGVIYRLSSDPTRLHGYNPTDVVCDELAQWTTPNLKRAFAALTSGGGARQAPQVYTITTAGEAATRHDSILGRMLDGALEHGEEESKPGLQILRHQAARMLVYNHEAPTTDPFDSKALKLANPASWITEAFLAKQAASPELTGAEVLQLHGCVWAAADTTWIAPDAWRACAAAGRIGDGERVCLGFDGSEKRDATALCISTLDGRVEILQLWERPQGAGDEWRIPRREVHEAVAAAFERFDVLELAADPPGWYSEIDEWVDKWGEDRVVPFDTNQGKRFAPACERFAAGVLDRTLAHNGDPVLARHVGYCVAVQSPYGVKVTKDSLTSPRKIDAAVAGVLAYDRAMWHAQNSRPLGPPQVAFV